MQYVDKIRQLKETCKINLLPLINKQCVLADAPYYDNIGDVLIWQGIADFLAENNRQCIHTSSMWTFDFPNLPQDTTILLTGGGNFGDLWRGFQEFRLKAIQFYPDNPIVMLPQSIWYEDINLLMSDALIMSRHKNLTLCARDRYTFDLFSRYFNANNILMVPDMAFCIAENRLDKYRKRSNPSKRLYFKRTDKELQADTVLNLNKNIDIRDWPSMEHKMTRFEIFRYIRGIRKRLPSQWLKYITGNTADYLADRYVRQSLVKMGCRFLAPYSHVTTTRLHAFILSVLLHKPVDFIDNTTGKLSAFAETWLNDIETVQPYTLNKK